MALGAAALAVWLGTHEWFFRDDFVFLERMQRPETWSWREVFLPFEKRLWIFYRPLSMDLYFYLGHRLFGLHALPYYLVSLAFGFASAFLVHRLALQLGFEPRAAAFAAVLAVTRKPLLTEVFYGSVFMYVAVIFCGLASAVAFLRHLERGGARWQLLSCVFLLLAFGCNEVAATIPGVLALLAVGAGHAALEPAALGRLARSLLPQALLTAGFLLFRFALVGPVENEFWNLVVVPTIYSHRLGPHALPNAGWLLAEVAGGGPALAVTLVLAAGATLGLWASPGGRAEARWLARVAAVAVAWIGLLLPAFALLPQREARWAMMLAAPFALLVSAPVSALLRARASERRGLVGAALVLLLIVALPVGPMLARAADPAGGPPRRLSAWVAAQRPPLPPDAVLVVLYGGPGLASEAEAIRLRASTASGRSLGVVEPGTRRSLRFHDVSRRAPRSALRPGSVYLKLLPGLDFERAGPRWQSLELPRGAPTRGRGIERAPRPGAGLDAADTPTRGRLVGGRRARVASAATPNPSIRRSESSGAAREEPE